MKKLIFCLLVMVFCNMVVFASITINNVQNIDLSNVYEHIGDLEMDSENEVFYEQNRVIGQITFENTSSENNLVLDFDDMNFQIATGSKRPYAVDIVYKQKVQFQNTSSGYTQSEIIHVAHGDSLRSFDIPATDETVTVGQIEEGGFLQDIYMFFSWLFWGHSLSEEYEFGDGILGGLESLAHYEKFKEDFSSAHISGVQIDIVLVLPELTAEEEYNMVNSDNGYVGTCKLSTGEEIRFYGSYKGKPENVELSLSVAQNDNSRAIDLDDSSVQPDSSGLDIGTYEYVVTYPAEYDGSHAFYLFASSSDDPTTSGDAFTLIHENGTNALEYEVGLSGGGSLEKWFSGTDSVAIGSGVTNDESKLLASDNNYSSYAVFDNGRTTRGYGGSILFRLTDAQMNDDPLAGDYSSTIYFHVISRE